MALSGVVGPIGCDTGDVLIGGHLSLQFGQHGRVAYIAAGDLDHPQYQRLFVDPDVGLAPNTAFLATELAGDPFAFALDLDACAFDQQVQLPL